ncbi:MAG: clostripain-related cysteine peptidase, partial [Anaerolineaceae bacterium]
MASQDSRETIEAQRRRRDSGGPRGRAEMPGRPSSGGGGMGSSGGGGGFSRIPGGRRSVPVGVVILILVCYFAYTLLAGGGDDGSQTTDLPTMPQGNEAEVVQNTSTPRPTRTPGLAASGSKQTWTVMLYQDADDSVLEQDIYMDLNEAERIGSTDQVNVVAQIDRYAGAYSGDGDWTTARRYYLTQDDDLFHLNSEMLADLGEVSMADPQTLIDFATWAIETYPADKYVLILSDHGMGWPGGWSDPKPAGKRSVDNAFSQVIEGNMLYTNELDQALGEIRSQTGLDHFELVGLDACLMSHIEVLTALEPHTRYVVTSQETEPALGWAYTGFLEALEADPGMDGAGLGEAIVSTYIDKDERIIDDQARADFLRQGSPMGGLFGGPVNISPATLASQLSKSITLTAADLDALPGLMDAVNQLAYALQKEDASTVARARTYAQSFTSIFGENVPPSYIDLG